jgi:hypothetical protein
MSVPRSTAKTSATVSAFHETSVDIGSVGANTSIDVEIAAPRAFQVGRLTLMEHTSALGAGLILSDVQVVIVGGAKKIRFRAQNTTAAAIDPAAQVFRFLQL